MIGPQDGRTYNGEIVGTKVVAGYKDQGMDAIFDLNLAECETVVTARVSCYGDFEDRTKAVFKVLGLPYPDGLADLDTTIGKEVEVYIKHRERGGMTEIKAYINVPYEPKELTKAEIKARLAGTDDSEVPF